MSCVMCHVSSVTCHMSCVTCHVSHVTFFLDKLLKPIGGGSVINGPTLSSFHTSDASTFYSTDKLAKSNVRKVFEEDV